MTLLTWMSHLLTLRLVPIRAAAAAQHLATADRRPEKTAAVVHSHSHHRHHQGHGAALLRAVPAAVPAAEVVVAAAVVVAATIRMISWRILWTRSRSLPRTYTGKTARGAGRHPKP
jgi:alkyl sulfatase BDS1-like metallo-beta-lactamase superfamily hydrolase